MKTIGRPRGQARMGPARLRTSPQNEIVDDQV